MVMNQAEWFSNAPHLRRPQPVAVDISRSERIAMENNGGRHRPDTLDRFGWIDEQRFTARFENPGHFGKGRLDIGDVFDSVH